MEGAIVPLTGLVNRQQKRRFKKEALKVAGELENVNTRFIWELWNAPEHLTYKQLYNHYLTEWQNTINRLASTKEFTTIGIDVLYFEREYKPQI